MSFKDSSLLALLTTSFVLMVCVAPVTQTEVCATSDDDLLKPLASRALQNGTRTLANAQFCCAVSTKPHQHSWGINPKKRGNFAGHFQSFIALQTLQSLYKEYSVIDFAIRAFFTVNTLTFKQELLSHGGRPFPRAAPREFHLQDTGDLVGY
jgi:hypothetical protein